MRMRVSDHSDTSTPSAFAAATTGAEVRPCRQVDHHDIRIGRHDARAAGAVDRPRQHARVVVIVRRAGRRDDRARTARRRRECRTAASRRRTACAPSTRLRCRRAIRRARRRSARRGPWRTRPSRCRAHVAISASGTPVATLAFQRRAPSMCTGRPRSAATA